MPLLVTRSALLELREERGVVREGYGFLDEKRLLLAAEIMRLLTLYQARQEAYLERHRAAREALRGAVTRHGLRGVALYPPLRPPGGLERTPRRFFGVTLAACAMLPADRGAFPPVDPSAEAEACREQFARLLALAAELAGLSASLERLMREYRKTERRARALEQVLLPELEESIAEVETRLEEMDQEEAVRVRMGRE